MIWLASLLLASSAFASRIAITDSFTANSLYSSGTALWDVNNGRIQAPIEIENFDDGGGLESRDIDAGDGHDGVFDSSTYANFDNDNDVSDNVIRIDTSVYTDLQFTSFTLDAGMTIRPVGDSPLIIRVIGDVLVNGDINCSGVDGEDLNADDSIVTSGGQGFCGGGDGGDGGSIGTGPSNGTAGGASVTGGTAGANLAVAGGEGGGGGGAYSDAAGLAPSDEGLNGAGAGLGNEGNIFTDHAYSEIGGGSGGGGGGAFDAAGVTDSSGGSGGGGGGVIYIIATGDVTVNGNVTANGGAGGSNATGLRGGGGGGGGGGSIGIWAGGEITNPGTITALAGAAGSTNAADGGDGGKGGEGRTWLSDVNILPSCFLCDLPGSFLVSFGRVRTKIGSSEVISEVIDTGDPLPTFLSGSLSTSGGGASSSASLQVSFGNTSDFTPVAWESVDNVTQATGQYLRFRILIDNQSKADPLYVTAVSFSLERFVEVEFDFSGGCGLVSGGDNGPTQGVIPWALFLLLLPMIFALGLRWRKSHSEC